MKKKDRELRDKEIIRMVIEGTPYIKISKKYGITAQRISQIIINNGIDIGVYRKMLLKKTLENIHTDIDNWLTLKEIRDKYGQPNIIRFNLSLPKGVTMESLIKKRNYDAIVEDFKTMPVSEIAKNKKYGLKPSSIYKLLTRLNVKRFENISNRYLGGTPEKTTILNIIKFKREKEKLTYTEIANFLDRYNIKTITGIPFTDKNISRIYRDIIFKNNPKSNIVEYQTSKKIKKIIKDKRENEKLTYPEIANFLNLNGYKAVRGGSYTESNVNRLYKGIKNNF